MYENNSNYQDLNIFDDVMITLYPRVTTDSLSIAEKQSIISFKNISS